MFLFLIAAGLSLIFGVLRVLNFAHGTFYMLGAYATYQLVQWMGVSGGRFWLTALGGALVVAALGGLIERFLFRRLYGKDELYQLLFTYALALILSDAAKMLWGTQQKSVSRPPELTGALHVFGAIIPHYNLFIILLGPAIALAFWLALQRTRAGRYIRAAALDRETLGALGVNVDALYTWVFVLASFLGGLGGALISPMRATTPGMDTEVIVEAFVVVVIGGLGSFWGTFLGALIYGQVLSFGSRFYTFVANDVVIWALFATSLNLLVGYTGLVSFGHAAYFGIGAYTTGILMKKLGVPFLLAFPAAGVLAAAFALLFGLFCVRLTRIYFAMLTLAFAQIVWAICFKWNEVTGGEQGMPEVPYPDLAWMGALPLVRDLRTS